MNFVNETCGTEKIPFTETRSCETAVALDKLTNADNLNEFNLNFFYLKILQMVSNSSETAGENRQ